MLKAKKSLGQNFLVNPHILEKIISAAEISKEDTIIEIGPGTGLLTKKLAEKAGRVIGVEKDHQLIEPLKETFKNYSNVEIVEADILGWCPPYTSYKVVANIPYYITSNFLRKVFEEWPQPRLIVLTIQREVAKRIIAKPPPKNGKAVSGQAHMNLLALSVQYYSEPEIIGYISKNNFRPVPKVDSAIIKLNVRVKTQNTKEVKRLFELMRIGFSEKRKILASLLSKKLKIEKERVSDYLKKEGIKENSRAENLSLEQWQKLTNYLFDSKI